MWLTVDYQRIKLITKLCNFTHQAICERKKTPSFYPKFVGSSMTNVTLSVLKDKAFAAMFGKGVSRPMSYTSMGE